MVMAAELGSMGLWAFIDTVIEVGLDNAFFYPEDNLFIHVSRAFNNF